MDKLKKITEVLEEYKEKRSKPVFKPSARQLQIYLDKIVEILEE